MTDDELPDEFAKPLHDAQCNLDRLREAAPTPGAEAAITDAVDSLEEAKQLTAKAVEIANGDDGE